MGGGGGGSGFGDGAGPGDEEPVDVVDVDGEEELGAGPLFEPRDAGFVVVWGAGEERERCSLVPAG